MFLKMFLHGRKVLRLEATFYAIVPVVAIVDRSLRIFISGRIAIIQQLQVFPSQVVNVLPEERVNNGAKPDEVKRRLMGATHVLVPFFDYFKPRQNLVNMYELSVVGME